MEDKKPISDLLKELPSSNIQNFSKFKPQCQQLCTKSTSYVCTQDDPTPPKRIITERNNILMKVLETAFPNTKSLKRDADEAEMCGADADKPEPHHQQQQAGLQQQQQRYSDVVSKQLRRDAQHRSYNTRHS